MIPLITHKGLHFFLNRNLRVDSPARWGLTVSCRRFFPLLWRRLKLLVDHPRPDRENLLGALPSLVPAQPPTAIPQEPSLPRSALLPSTVPSSLPSGPRDRASPPFVEDNRPSLPSPPSPSSFSSSPSSIRSAMTTQSEHASLDHTNPSKLPILTEGILTPRIASRFELGCLDYFGIKDTATKKQVPLAMASIRDGHMRDWINSDRDHLKTLSFGDFINEIRERYLDADWEDKIRREILCCELKQPAGIGPPRSPIRIAY